MSPIARRWLAAALLVGGNLILHKPFSDVCDAVFARIGRQAYEWTSLAVIGALSALGAFLLWRGGGARLAQPRPLAALAVLAALTLLAQRVLLVSNVELIHLPQFALLAALLLAVGLSAEGAWLGATLGGVLDEAYQRLVIYPAIPNVYFDWNDIVLNGLGAAVAVVLLRGGGTTAGPPAWRPAALGVALAGTALACWLAPPQVHLAPSAPWVTPVLAPALTGRLYHVMPAGEGMLALGLLWALVAFAVHPAGRAPR